MLWKFGVVVFVFLVQGAECHEIPDIQTETGEQRYEIVGGIIVFIGMVALVAMCMDRKVQQSDPIPPWVMTISPDPALDVGITGTSDGINAINNNCVHRHRKGHFETDGARWGAALSKGKHVFEVYWPQYGRGTMATVGVGTEDAPLFVKPKDSLVGCNKESWGFDIVRRRLLHNGQMLGTMPRAGIVPDKFYMYVDCDGGTLGFGTDHAYWGAPLNIPRQNFPVYPMIGSMCANSQITMIYRGSENRFNAPGNISHVMVPSQGPGGQVQVTVVNPGNLCGAGYKAVETNEGFVCKVERQTITCPHSYTLTTRNGQTLCVKGQCSESGGYQHDAETLGGCHERMPECADSYTLNDDVGGSYCVLNTIQHFLSEPVRPCNGDASLRACEVQADDLVHQCNPECANGGTCVNNSCVCPSGITGHACHLDVNECLTHSCDYQCENTFGSFHCVCPVGMMLDLDGVACKDIGCVQPCLNNGTCRQGYCVCSSGFEGEHCEIDKDECAVYGERLCQYQCRNTYGGYQCICPPGSTLNTDHRTCTNTTCNPECRNGGICRNHKCQCPKTFYGIICQFDVNECRHTQPCDQICRNSWGSYRCSCTQGFILQPDNRTCKDITGSQ